jgi:hypothetical protein
MRRNRVIKVNVMLMEMVKEVLLEDQASAGRNPAGAFRAVEAGDAVDAGDSAE